MGCAHITLIISAIAVALFALISAVLCRRHPLMYAARAPRAPHPSLWIVAPGDRLDSLISMLEARAQSGVEGGLSTTTKGADQQLYTAPRSSAPLAVVFLPGVYDFSARTLYVGWATEIVGGGESPGDTILSNVAIRTFPVSWLIPPATQIHRRAMCNITIEAPAGNVMQEPFQWLTSLGCYMRGVNIKGAPLALNPRQPFANVGGGFFGSSIEAPLLTAVAPGQRTIFLDRCKHLTSHDPVPVAYTGVLAISLPAYYALNNKVVHVVSDKTTRAFPVEPSFLQRPHHLGDASLFHDEYMITRSEVRRERPLFSLNSGRHVDSVAALYEACEEEMAVIWVLPGIYRLHRALHIARGCTLAGVGFPTLEFSDGDGVILAGSCLSGVTIRFLAGAQGGCAVDVVPGEQNALLADVSVECASGARLRVGVRVRRDATLVENMWVYSLEKAAMALSRSESPGEGGGLELGVVVEAATVRAQNVAVEHTRGMALHWIGDGGSLLCAYIEGPWTGPFDAPALVVVEGEYFTSWGCIISNVFGTALGAAQVLVGMDVKRSAEVQSLSVFNVPSSSGLGFRTALSVDKEPAFPLVNMETMVGGYKAGGAYVNYLDGAVVRSSLSPFSRATAGPPRSLAQVS